MSHGRRPARSRYSVDDEWEQNWDEREDPRTPVGSRTARRVAQRQQGRDRRRSVVAAVVVLAVFATLGLVGWFGYSKVRDFFSPPDYDGAGSGEVLIQVRDGDSAGQIGNTLVREQVVKSGAAFVNAAKDEPRSARIQPGTYRMRKKMSAGAALSLMLEPTTRVVNKFTIPEGRSVRQTFAEISKQVGVPVADLEAAAADPASLGLPSWGRGNLEGFLFPETYELQPDMDAKQLLTTMVSHSVAVFNELGLEAKAAEMGKDPYELLTVASLVEGEGVAGDFGKISRVIYNRLAEVPFLLNMDSTTQYWLEISGQGRKKRLADGDLRNANNNYSTTLHPGLPPTAIASPGRGALNAAINPEPGPWRYFVVVDENGTSAFAETMAEHEANVRICVQKNLGC